MVSFHIIAGTECLICSMLYKRATIQKKEQKNQEKKKTQNIFKKKKNL